MKDFSQGFHLTVRPVYKRRTMSSLTGILSLLSALAASSYALSCTTCVSTSSSTCSGSRMTCPLGYKCGSSYTETTIGGTAAFGFLLRSCMPSSKCYVIGSIGLEQGQVKMVTSCCDTDGCTPSVPSLPAHRYDPNGLVCRSCVSHNSTWCYTPDTIQCTGNENMCLLQTTNITGSKSSSSAIRGCATQSICDLGSQSYSARGLSSEVKFICTSGGTSVHTVVLTPAIACLLLLKWFS